MLYNYLLLLLLSDDILYYADGMFSTLKIVWCNNITKQYNTYFKIYITPKKTIDLVLKTRNFDVLQI